MNRDEMKLIIFDMDGVILDSEPLHENARQMMFKEYGVIPDETFPDPVGKSSSGFWRTMIEMGKLKGDPYDLEEKQYRLVAWQIEQNKVPPSEGLIDVLTWAKDHGVKIGLASSSTRTLVDDALRLLGISRYFEYTVSGNEVKVKKPAPDVYLKVLQMAGVKAEEAAAVEDSSAGVEAAKNARIFCFGYKNETSGGQDISQADVAISHLKEILEVKV